MWNPVWLPTQWNTFLLGLFVNARLSLRSERPVSCWPCLSSNLSLRRLLLWSHCCLSESFLVCEGRNCSPWMSSFPGTPIRCIMGSHWQLVVTGERWVTGPAACATVPVVTPPNALLSKPCPPPPQHMYLSIASHFPPLWRSLSVSCPAGDEFLP